jgi:hypothetical protein
MAFEPIINRILRAGLLYESERRMGDRRAEAQNRPQNAGGVTTVPNRLFNSYVPDYSYNVTRGILAIKDDVAQYLIFQFNPEEITDTKEVTYEDRPRLGFDHQNFIWVNGGPRTISFTLKLDATNGSKVTHLGKLPNDSVGASTNNLTHDPAYGTLKQVQFLQSLQRPKEPGQTAPRFIRTAALPNTQFTPPPLVIFNYGPMYLEGVISSLSVSHKEFNRALVPVMTDVTVTFKVQEGKIIAINPQITTLAGSLTPAASPLPVPGTALPPEGIGTT